VAQKIKCLNRNHAAAGPCVRIDSRLSANKEIGFEKEATAHFIRQVLRPGDRLQFCVLTKT